MPSVPIPLNAGVSISAAPDVRTEYPLNLVPCPPQDGVSDMYLRPAEGIVSFATGEGSDRGAIVWLRDGVQEHYRISGTKLIRVNGANDTDVLGDVAGSGQVRMAYGFDRIGFVSDGVLNYWDGTTLSTVTDPDVPPDLISSVWIDSYWAMTDGVEIAVTDLADQTAVNPTRFATTDRPDPIQCLLTGVNELTVVSRHFIDTFENVGGTGFPFARVEGAVVTKGAVGRHSACVFNDTVAFVGSGFEEACSVYLARNGQVVRIATVEIDRLLGEYTEAQLQTVTMQAVAMRGGQYLRIHLPDRTIVYDAIASKMQEQPVWHVLSSGSNDPAKYKGQNVVLMEGRWFCGDPDSSAIGELSETESEHFGSVVMCGFDTLLMRNDVYGTALHALHLFALTGVVDISENPSVACQYTEDGENYSMLRFAPSGRSGQKGIRIIWRRNGKFHNFRMYRFRFTSESRLSIMGLNAELSPLKF